jgi:hypothetical protein
VQLQLLALLLNKEVVEVVLMTSLFPIKAILMSVEDRYSKLIREENALTYTLNMTHQMVSATAVQMSPSIIMEELTTCI